jgi:hypothetical protein
MSRKSRFPQCGGDPSVPRMAVQWRGWPHRTGGDGGDALYRPYITASSQVGVELVVVPLSRVSSSFFEGRDMEEVRE